MVQDPAIALDRRMTEGFDPVNERIYLDGPVAERLAVLDFDPETGKLVKGARFVGPSKHRKTGHFVDENGKDVYDAKGEEVYSPAFMQVSSFATVLKTIYLFEGTGEEKIDTLGRPVKWSFNAPQLLIVPRAGENPNAYYHRDSHSLQFYFFKPRDKKKVYTCLSRDIIAHETGHAIVDGIAPDLMDACTPHSLAVHEAMADLTALLMAFNSHNLREAVLKKTGGSLKESTEFTSIAEEFGERRYLRRYLRNLRNEKTLNPKGGRECVDQREPHDLSQVLSGALYNVLAQIHEKTKKDYSAKSEGVKSEFSVSGKALYDTSRWFKRMIFRALDYLPPGEISFADYGRALIAVDTIAYPENEEWRKWIRNEFVRRWIVRDETALAVETKLDTQPIRDVQNLIDSDWAAYDFANKHRDLLLIPEGIQFQVRPRLLVHKKYDKDIVKRECLFKVLWEHVEDNELSGYPKERLITVGTTISFRYEDGEALARLTNSPQKQGHLKDEYEEQRRLRTEFLKRLDDRGILLVGRQGYGFDGRPLISAIQAQIIGGRLKLQGTGKTLQILGGAE